MCGNYPRLVAVLAVLAGMPLGCADADSSAPADADESLDSGSFSEVAAIKGRVTDVTGIPLKDVEVTASGSKGRTDEQGRFEIMVPASKETRLSVESDKYSGAALAVKPQKDVGAQVELSVKERSSVTLSAAEKGGRVEGTDGFALELPAGGLKDASEKAVSGAVEVRYAIVKRASDVSAAPGRMETDNQKGLDGYGIVEVRFYKDGQRVTPIKEMRVEVPLHDEHGLAEGQEVELYGLGKSDTQWKATAKAKVQANKVVVSTMRDDWLGAAQETPVSSCVSGTLGVAAPGGGENSKLKNTAVRAARARGLSLVQAQTADDGSFCLPVSPDDDWHVTTYYDDSAQSYGLAVDLNSSNAAGMCGGSGCKNLGEVPLPALE
ncbi:MAG: hypothetical protein QM778_33545 [Myxococcales bacterium]